MSATAVIVTSVGGNVGQGVVKALRAAGTRFRIVGIDMEPLSAWFSLMDVYHTVPRCGDEGFEERLAEICRLEKIEAIFVCSPAELNFFSANRKKIEAATGSTVFVNPARVIEIGGDKQLTADFLKSGGFTYPESCPVDDLEGVNRLIADFGFPLIAKPRCGASSKNVFLVNRMNEILACRALVEDLIVQRYVGDAENEFTASTVSGYDGRVRATIVLHRHLLQGTTYRTELVSQETTRETIISIVEALGAVGPCNLQFRLLNGKPCVFEINPRFSGTSGIRYLYGFNDPAMIFDLLKLGKEVSQPTLNPAVVFRYWNEIYIPGADFNSIRNGTSRHLGREIITDARTMDGTRQRKKLEL